MDAYSTTSLTKAIEQIGERLGHLEELPDKVDFLYNGLEHIGTQLERIATVMEMDSDRFQEKKRQEAAERTRRMQQHGQELTAR